MVFVINLHHDLRHWTNFRAAAEEFNLHRAARKPYMRKSDIYGRQTFGQKIGSGRFPALLVVDL